MEKVTGIGGFFFRSEDPKALTKWYEQNLGVGGTPGPEGNEAWRQDSGPTAFAPFPADTKYFENADKQWMLNFRVSNLDAMIAQLNTAGIEVEVDPESYDMGRFARLKDPEGNPIQLWEDTRADKKD